MKHFAIGGLLAVALVGSASATDLPVKAPAIKAAPVQAFSWTGCYVGGHIGWMKSDSKLTTSPSGLNATGLTPGQLAASTFEYGADGSDATAGVQYGCNRQFGNLVVGLDSSFSWSGLNETVNASVPLGVFLAHTESITQELNWYSTTRGRVGWAFDRWMVFAAGGLATGRVESTYSSVFPAGPFAGSEAKNRYGWTVGGGVEYALSQNWWLRGEYLFVDLGKYNYDSVQPAVGPTSTWNTEVNTQFHVARVGLSYRFTQASSLIEWAAGGFK